MKGHKAVVRSLFTYAKLRFDELLMSSVKYSLTLPLFNADLGFFFLHVSKSLLFIYILIIISKMSHADDLICVHCRLWPGMKIYSLRPLG